MRLNASRIKVLHFWNLSGNFAESNKLIISQKRYDDKY